MGQRFANSRQRGRVHTQLRRRDGSCVCARHAYSDSYTYCDANSHAYSDTNSHGHGYSDTQRHADCYTNIYAEVSPNSQASSHSTAKALG